MSDARSILVVDDDPGSARYMALALGRQYSQVRTAGDGIQALLAMEEALRDLVVSDLSMPNMGGLELLTLIRQRWPGIPVILATVEEEMATIIEAVQLGASNYLVKPVGPMPLVSAVERALRTAVARPPTGSLREIVGVSAAMVRVRQLVSLAARSDVNVLITGETGTGKELVARSIHRLSALGDGPWVACNCAAIPPDLFESTFFGHVRGAFTGAHHDQQGLLQQSHEGVLFLDELECLSLAHQAKLLRVIDDGEIRPVGSTKVERVSIRFVAATNSDPVEQIRRRELRQDLYYRLRGFEIHLPPLRERRDDIAALASHALGGDSDRLSPGALTALECHSWPGNVRELNNVVRNARAHAGDRAIQARDLLLIAQSTAPITPTVPTSDRVEGANTLDDLERRAVADALRECKGNRSHAADLLGINRATLRRKMQRFGIS